MTELTPAAAKRSILDVLASIAPEFDLAALAAAKPLREQIDLDSFDFLNVLIALKERTGVEIPEKDYARVQTLDDMAGYLCERAAPRT